MNRSYRIIFALLFLFLSFSFFLKEAKAISTLGGIDFDPDPLVFPSIRVGDTSNPEAIQATKSSLLPLVDFVFGSFLTNPHNFDLVNDGCQGSFLVNGDSCEDQISFNPHREAVYKAHLVLVSTEFRIFNFVRVIGRGFIPRARIRPNNVDFGNQTVSTSSTPTEIRVRSVGTGPLTISDINISLGSDVFSIADTDCLEGPLDPHDFCTIEIVFTPNDTVAFVGEVEITDDAENSPQQVNLEGTGTAPGEPAITLSTNFVEFENTQIGTSATPINVTVTSTGNVAVNISDITSNNSAIFPLAGNCISGLPLSLNPGETCVLEAGFDPIEVGTDTSNITFLSDATDEPVLSTEGIGFDASAADFGLSVNNLDFGEITVGETSESQNVVVTNDGTVALNFESIEFGGANPHSFSMIDDCIDDELVVGASCNLEVFCVPQVEGSLSATIELLDNFGDFQTVTLQCVGVIPGNFSGGGCALNSPIQVKDDSYLLVWLFLAGFGFLIRRQTN